MGLSFAEQHTLWWVANSIRIGSPHVVYVCCKENTLTQDFSNFSNNTLTRPEFLKATSND